MAGRDPGSVIGERFRSGRPPRMAPRTAGGNAQSPRPAKEGKSSVAAPVGHGVRASGSAPGDSHSRADSLAPPSRAWPADEATIGPPGWRRVGAGRAPSVIDHYQTDRRLPGRQCADRVAVHAVGGRHRPSHQVATTRSHATPLPATAGSGVASDPAGPKVKGAGRTIRTGPAASSSCRRWGSARQSSSSSADAYRRSSPRTSSCPAASRSPARCRPVW